jgi:hypothetical protein
MKKYFKITALLAVMVLIVGASTLAIKPNHTQAYCTPSIPSGYTITNFSVASDGTASLTVVWMSCNGTSSFIPTEASITAQGYPSSTGYIALSTPGSPASGSLNITGLSPGTYTAVATINGNGSKNPPIIDGDTATTNFTIVAPSTYTVSTSAGSGGTISPSSTTVNSGSTATFTVTPNSGYSIASVSDNCGSGGSGTSTYTTGAITSNCTVTATFSGGGTINVTSANSQTGAPVSSQWDITNAGLSSDIVGSGTSQTYTNEPAATYTVASVTPPPGYALNSVSPASPVERDGSILALLRSVFAPIALASWFVPSGVSQNLSPNGTATFNINLDPIANIGLEDVNGTAT